VTDPDLATLLDNLLRKHAPNADWAMVGGVIRITGADARAVRAIAQRVKAHGWGVAVEVVA
jgi:hypothetical protein